LDFSNKKQVGQERTGLPAQENQENSMSQKDFCVVLAFLASMGLTGAAIVAYSDNQKMWAALIGALAVGSIIITLGLFFRSLMTSLVIKEK
jgi:fatty acid desaturase